MAAPGGSLPPLVSVAPAALDELLTLAGGGLVSARFALAIAGGSQTAQEHGQKAVDTLLKVCQRLEALGAQDRAPLVKPAPTNPLAELAKLDASRAEALALLDALRHAHQLAEKLDQKRGDVLEEPVGGSAGLVWGDRLIQAVCGLELEIYGPGERVTGARE